MLRFIKRAHNSLHNT